mgnify:FL=1
MQTQQTWDLEDVKEELKALIRIPSVTGGEEAISQHIFSRLKQIGADYVEKQLVEEGRYNVIARIHGAFPGRRILLTGHMDTVAPGDGWTTEPFEPVERDGKIFGRGANDMKAGIAIIIQVAAAVVAHRQQFSGTLEIVFVCDEEAYSKGMRCFMGINPTADFCIAAEPEFATMQIGACGKLLIRARAYGRSAHAAQPEKGINAVEEMGRLLGSLRNLPLYSHSTMDSQPYVTLQVKGGGEEYQLVVPDTCTALINKHIVPGETAETICEDLRNQVKCLGLHAEFTFETEVPFYPPYVVEETHPDVQKIRQLYYQVTGKTLQVGYADGVCDNNYLAAECGIPAVCFGPGGGGMHAADEWVSVEEMSVVMQVYMRYLLGEEQDAPVRIEYIL